MPCEEALPVSIPFDSAENCVTSQTAPQKSLTLLGFLSIILCEFTALLREPYKNERG